MRVGWLGLGAMGAPMAACLARSGHSVHAYDIAPERAAALAADGVQAADTIAAAVGGAEAVAIMVATPDQVEQALFAPGGAAAALPGGWPAAGWPWSTPRCRVAWRGPAPVTC